MTLPRLLPSLHPPPALLFPHSRTPFLCPYPLLLPLPLPLLQVTTSEMVQTMAVNAVAPFVLCTLLQPLLTPPAHRHGPGPSPPDPLDGVRSHVVNVTALEGKFNVGKKSGGHPHTNMAKVRPIQAPL